jgi:hypothetical protein
MGPKVGNQFPKKGNKLHLGNLKEELSYELLVASALRRELGGSHRAVKTLMKWTGASERTAKNWLSGAVGPNGEHLVQLLGFSDEVFETVLTRSNRRRSPASDRVAGVRILLADALSLLND